jgi:hypothetical protein
MILFKVTGILFTIHFLFLILILVLVAKRGSQLAVTIFFDFRGNLELLNNQDGRIFSTFSWNWPGDFQPT